jgi:hypothetical protein
LRADEVINRGFGLPLHKRDTSTAILYRNYLTGELYAGSTYLQDRFAGCSQAREDRALELNLHTEVHTEMASGAPASDL